MRSRHDVHDASDVPALKDDESDGYVATNSLKIIPLTLGEKMTDSTTIRKLLITSALSFGLSAGAIADDKASHPNLSATPENATLEKKTPGEANAQEVANYKTNAGEQANDEEISKRVKAVLAQDKGLQGQNITVETKGGVTMIAGTVSSEDAYKKTVAAAKKVDGVTKVEATGLRVKSN